MGEEDPKPETFSGKVLRWLAWLWRGWLWLLDRAPRVTLSGRERVHGEHSHYGATL